MPPPPRRLALSDVMGGQVPADAVPEDQPGDLDENYLRDHFRQLYQQTHDTPAGAMPEVAHPAIFQKDPLIVGTPAQARWIYDAVARIAPMYMDKVKVISRPATTGSMRMMAEEGKPLTQTTGTTLRGTTDQWQHVIFIAPDAPNPLRVLVHELAHIAGTPEAGAQQMIRRAGQGPS
jgi:hypothetical protein